MTYIRKCNRCGKEIGEDVQANDNELHFTKQRNTRYGYDKCMHLCNDRQTKITFDSGHPSHSGASDSNPCIGRWEAMRRRRRRKQKSGTTWN